jgi:hypothetical protein
MDEHIANLTEKRRHYRTQLQMTLRCIRLDPDCGEVVDTLHMLDISRSGMGAICDRAFYPGQRLVLCVPMTDKSGRRNIYATVLRCRQAEEGYAVGLEFDRSSLGARSPIAMAETAAA